MPSEHIRIQIRLPADLHARLVKAASDGTRSLNGEMVARLESSFVEPPQESPRAEAARMRTEYKEIYLMVMRTMRFEQLRTAPPGSLSKKDREELESLKREMGFA